MGSKYYNQKEFICSWCGKDFKKLRQLKAHIKDSHSMKKVKDERKIEG